MGITVYRVRDCNGWKIDLIEATRTSAKSIWIESQLYGGDRRLARITTWECFFDTWDEAHAHAIKHAENDIEKAIAKIGQAERELLRCKEQLKTVQDMAVAEFMDAVQ